MELGLHGLQRDLQLRQQQVVEIVKMVTSKGSEAAALQEEILTLQQAQVHFWSLQACIHRWS